MWAVDTTTNFLRTPVEMRDLIEAAGFRMQAWDDMKPQPARPASTGPTSSIQSIVMGDSLATITQTSQLNRDEGRIVDVRAVFDRP